MIYIILISFPIEAVCIPSQIDGAQVLINCLVQITGLNVGNCAFEGSYVVAVACMDEIIGLIPVKAKEFINDFCKNMLNFVVEFSFPKPISRLDQ